MHPSLVVELDDQAGLVQIVAVRRDEGAVEGMGCDDTPVRGGQQRIPVTAGPVVLDHFAGLVGEVLPIEAVPVAREVGCEVDRVCVHQGGQAAAHEHEAGRLAAQIARAAQVEVAEVSGHGLIGSVARIARQVEAPCSARIGVGDGAARERYPVVDDSPSMARIVYGCSQG